MAPFRMTPLASALLAASVAAALLACAAAGGQCSADPDVQQGSGGRVELRVSVAADGFAEVLTLACGEGERRVLTVVADGPAEAVVEGAGRAVEVALPSGAACVVIVDRGEVAVEAFPRNSLEALLDRGDSVSADAAELDDLRFDPRIIEGRSVAIDVAGCGAPLRWNIDGSSISAAGAVDISAACSAAPGGGGMLVRMPGGRPPCESRLSCFVGAERAGEEALVRFLGPSGGSIRCAVDGRGYVTVPVTGEDVSIEFAAGPRGAWEGGQPWAPAAAAGFAAAALACAALAYSRASRGGST